MDMVKKYGKKIALDVAGISLIAIAPFIGWLPGPGGIPLLLAGLGLLSINHEWARRGRDYFIHKGSKLTKVLFPDNTSIQWLYDIFSILLMAGAYNMYRSSESIWGRGASTAVLTAAIAILVINRHRLEWLNHQIKDRFKHKH